MLSSAKFTAFTTTGTATTTGAAAAAAAAAAGMQLVNKVFGGSVSRSTEREDGQHNVTCEGGSALFAGLPDEQEVLLTHGDSVSDVAAGKNSIFF
jgi:GMP synthase-like glutamine amidotransferase